VKVEQSQQSREALGKKLHAALQEEVALVDRVQKLEAERTGLQERVAVALSTPGTDEAVQRLMVQLAASEAERSAASSLHPRPEFTIHRCDSPHHPYKYSHDSVVDSKSPCTLDMNVTPVDLLNLYQWTVV
jgi:hypothetical protein